MPGSTENREREGERRRGQRERERGRERERERKEEKNFFLITESAKGQNNSLFAADVFCASLREEMSTVTDFSTSDTSFILLLGRGQLPDSLSSSAYLRSTSSQRFSRAFRASWDVLSEAKYYIKGKEVMTLYTCACPTLHTKCGGYGSQS